MSGLSLGPVEADWYPQIGAAEATAAKPREAATGDANAGRVLAAYLANYDQRRAGSVGVTFPRPDFNAMVAVVYAQLMGRLRSPIAREVISGQLHAHAAIVVQEAEAGLGADIAGYALALASLGGKPAGPDLIRAFDAGKAPDKVSGLLWAGWRSRFLDLAVDKLSGARRMRAEEESEHYRAQLMRKAQQLAADPDDLALAARTAWLAAPADGRGERAAAARALVDAFFERHRGNAIPDRPEQPTAARTVDLAWLMLAAQASGLRRQAERVLAWLLARRLDTERGMLLADDSTDAQLEMSPLVVMALAVCAPGRLDEVDGMLDPQVPALPDFRIVGVASTSEAITYELEVSGRPARRRVDARELNLLVAEILNHLYDGMEEDRGTPRQHAHLVMALGALHVRSADDVTAATIEGRIHVSLEEILSRQRPAGGWSYARADAPSTVYTVEGKTTTRFPDREYAIDAAVPGTALCQQFLRTGDERCLAAAHRAFGFFEQTVGRVQWGRREVWRLYPGDEKTPEQGSAVNYELWAGCFCAHLAAITRDDDVRDLARAYATAAVVYAADYVDGRADMAYGDYVAEKRTAYASWDAWLLAQIGALTEDGPARELAGHLVERIAELILPNGVIPNVSDYLEPVGEHARWSVHRHGIGPYPVRNWYQLYFVIAAATAGKAADGALRALGFVLIDLWDEAFVSIGSGYNGDGRFSDVPGLRGEQMWILHALAMLPDICDFDYRPALHDVRSWDERVASAARRCWAASEVVRSAAGPAAREIGAGQQARILIDLAVGSSSLYRHSRAEDWLDEAATSAERLLSLQVGDRWHLDAAADQASLSTTATAGLALLDVQAITGDQRLADAAQAAAAWLAPVFREQRPRLDYGTLARCVVFLSRASQHEPAWEPLVDAGLRRLVAGQNRRGLWPIGPETPTIDQRTVLVLGRLMDIAWSPWGSTEIDRVLRNGIDSCWKTLFAPNGRRYATPQRAAPMLSALGLSFATTCCEGAARFADETLLQRAHAILRYTFHVDRTPDGDVRTTRYGGQTDPSCSARCFAELARILERAPDVARS